MDGSANAPGIPTDRLACLPKPASPAAVRERLIDLLRRDLIGAHPDLDPDLDREVLTGTNPSNWYLTGYLGPRRKTSAARRLAAIDGSEAAAEEAAELQLEAQRSSEAMELGAPGPGGAPDDGSAERPPVRSFEPSSLGLTVLLPRDARELQARVTWGDYLTEPPLDDAVFLADARRAAEARGEKVREPKRGDLDWRRIPREERLPIPLRPGEKPQEIIVPGSAAPMAAGGGLKLVVSARPTETAGIDGVKRDLLAISVFLVNFRREDRSRFADVFRCFQARLQLDFVDGFESCDDRASYDATDPDERLADLHYRDVRSYAVGHNTSGDWGEPDEEGRVTCVFTNPLPAQTVEKLGADIDKPAVERGIEALEEAAKDAMALDAALSALPVAYAAWAQEQARQISRVDGSKRREVAEKCLKDIEITRHRIESGLARLKADPTSREAFRIMNRVMARSNRQRNSTLNSKPPDDQKAPAWRLFQIAFILLNLDGLVDPAHADRPIVDLLFFPTGGGKTEAYLGLAAFAIARHRLDNEDFASAGVSVVMRYTLRLLTLDQLQRAAGLVCALELERKADRRLGSWPIEIGLWVGGKATPNNLGGAKNRKGSNIAINAGQPHRRSRNALGADTTSRKAALGTAFG
jgi:hypothetical protein